MDSCIFCKIINKEIPGKIIYEDELCIAFLDLSQVTNGHTLVIPKKHFKNILDDDEETVSHIFKIASLLAKKITTSLNAKGCNILSNANEVAGQTVSHFHVHIIPRYSEDDNIKITFNEREDNFNLDDIYNSLK